MAQRLRKPIASPDAVAVSGTSPLAAVSQLAGVRIFDVGQGDAIAVLGNAYRERRPVLQLDYGGRERNPFALHTDVDDRMPVASGDVLMLSHWDEDHWCSASKGSSARDASWLVPRQLTSPRAVLFSASLDDIHCIPEQFVGQTLRYATQGDDYVLWQKIGYFPGAFAKAEDCNRSGVALAVVHRGVEGEEEAILLPGDAPFDAVSMFSWLAGRGVKLRGIVAFHHGAGTHWSDATRDLLRNWTTPGRLDVVFSCSQPSSYHHPDEDQYRALLPDANFQRTATARAQSMVQIDLLF